MLVVAVLAVAAGAGLVLTGGGKPGGVAHALALVDTPSSQVVDLGGDSQVDANINTLSMRATLLAGLMTSSPLKEEIAARAGIAPSSLLALSPATQTTAPAGGATGASSTTTATTPTAKQPNVLTANVPELSTGQVPIITVDTQAPTMAAAQRLANSSIEVLSQYMQSLGVQDNVPASRRVVVRQLGAATATPAAPATSKIMAGGAVIVVLALGLAIIFGIPAVKASWRRADELAALEDPEPRIEDRVTLADNATATQPHHSDGASRRPAVVHARPQEGVPIPPPAWSQPEPVNIRDAHRPARGSQHDRTPSHPHDLLPATAPQQGLAFLGRKRS